MIIDSKSKTIRMEVAFFGPNSSGKTTSIQSLLDHYKNNAEFQEGIKSDDIPLREDSYYITFRNNQ